VGAFVRNLNEATIVSSTTVDIWRPQFGTNKASDRGGQPGSVSGPSDAFKYCNGAPLDLKSAPDFVKEVQEKAYKYGFVNKVQTPFHMALRNGAIFFNNEIEQVNALLGTDSRSGFYFRRNSLNKIILKMLPSSLNMLPTTEEGMESFTSVLVEIFGHKNAKEDLCLFSTSNLQNVHLVVSHVNKKIIESKLQVRIGVIKGLSQIVEACTDCLLTGSPLFPEFLRKIEATVHGAKVSSTEVTEQEDNNTKRVRRETHVRALSAELLQKRLNIAYEFNTIVFEDLCKLSLDAADERQDNQILIQGVRHSLVFKRAYSWSPQNIELFVPGYSDGKMQCGPVNITITDRSGKEKLDVCAVVYHYNPVDSPSAMTSDFTSDGSLQRQYNVSWPLSSSVCPVRVTTHSVPRASQKDYLYLPTRITFDISHDPAIVRNWFIPKAPDPSSALDRLSPPSFNTLAYHDIWFAGICQEWGIADAERGSWVQVKDRNQTVHYNKTANLKDVDVCLEIHPTNGAQPVPKEMSNGKVTCLFLPRDRDIARAKGTRFVGLYGVVAERADCQGSYSPDTTLTSKFDFDTGQLEYGRSNSKLNPFDKWPATRKVCDKCARCGGFNADCSIAMGCDGQSPSLRRLDLCGKCGGNCFGPPFGKCSLSQCTNLLLTFSAGQRASTTKFFFGTGLCSQGAAGMQGKCENLIDGTCEKCSKETSTPEKLRMCLLSCQKEVRSETYWLDSNHLQIYEDVPYQVPPFNLSLETTTYPDRVVVMHLCPINLACQQYVWEQGRDVGKTPRCQELLKQIPECALQCATPDDYFDPTIFCAAGDFELPASLPPKNGVCVRPEGSPGGTSGPGMTGTYVQGNPNAPDRGERAGTLWRCSGTPADINRDIQGLIYTPPKLYSSGRPPQSFVFWRFTFELFDPTEYRKDVNVTVLPVNSPPVVSGSKTFKVQEDRPTILSPNTPGKPGLLAVSILDDAAYQLPNQVSVAFTIHKREGAGRISIGGSRDPPLCPGCPPGSGGAVMKDAHTCICLGGPQWSKGVSPWYGPGQTLTVHATM